MHWLAPDHERNQELALCPRLACFRFGIETREPRRNPMGGMSVLRERTGGPDTGPPAPEGRPRSATGRSATALILSYRHPLAAVRRNTLLPTGQPRRWPLPREAHVPAIDVIELIDR